MKTYYIDPNYTGNISNGSIEYPYKNWNIKFESNSRYLQKRNTEILIEKTIDIKGTDIPMSNIILGSYGEGNRPIIKTNEKIDLINITICDGVTIENLKFIGNDTKSCISPTGYWNSGTINNPTPWCRNVSIKNCGMSNAFHGVKMRNYSTGVDSVIIENCDIYDIVDDEIFMDNVTNVSVINSNKNNIKRPSATTPIYPL